jgi:hypothetical protein
MRITLKNFFTLDVEDLFRQADLRANGVSVHQLRSLVCSIDSCITLLKSKKAKEKRWCLRTINKRLEDLALHKIHPNFIRGKV